jgi:hypothetical protein
MITPGVSSESMKKFLSKSQILRALSARLKNVTDQPSSKAGHK